MIISDINDDGKPDIITTNHYGGKLNILLNNGDQLYLPPAFYFIASPAAISLADVNNDGKVDIICRQNDGYALSIIINHGGGVFSDPIQHKLDQNISPWTSIDINGDGKVDILSSYDNFIWILINMGNGSFYPQFNYFTTSRIAYIAAADLNNDKYNDIIISYRDENKISIVINNGNGNFKYPISYSPLIDFFPSYITTFDLNNDQKLDIILTNRNIPNIVIFYNIGHGHFAFHTTYSTRQPASYVAPIHINNDNITDFIYLTNNGIGIISTDCY